MNDNRWCRFGRVRHFVFDGDVRPARIHHDLAVQRIIDFTRNIDVTTVRVQLGDNDGAFAFVCTAIVVDLEITARRVEFLYPGEVSQSQTVDLILCRSIELYVERILTRFDQTVNIERGDIDIDTACFDGRRSAAHSRVQVR